MSRTRYIARAGMIAAVYAALTFITMQFLQGFAWGPVQFRVSEAVTVLAFFTPAAVPGLVLGCALANLTNLGALGPIVLLDVVFGSAASGIGAYWMWRFRDRTALGLLGPVIANALVVPAYLPWLVKGFGVYKIPLIGVDVEGSWPLMYLFGVLFVGLGEAVVMYVIGWPLVAALRRLGLAEVIDRSA